MRPMRSSPTSYELRRQVSGDRCFAAQAVDYSMIADDIAENRGYRQFMALGKFRIARSRTGLGMFAVEPYRRRDYIATYRGPRIKNEDSEKREARGASYMFALNKTHTIDGSPR